MPFVIHKLVWLSNTESVKGTMGFVGKSYTGTIIHSYSNISFEYGGQKIWFNGNDNIFFKPGEMVPVRFPKGKPDEARIDNFVAVWGDTVVYGGIFVLLILVICVHPQLIPYKSDVRLIRRKPFIELV